MDFNVVEQNNSSTFEKTYYELTEIMKSPPLKINTKASKSHETLNWLCKTYLQNYHGINHITNYYTNVTIMWKKLFSGKWRHNFELLSISKCCHNMLKLRSATQWNLDAVWVGILSCNVWVLLWQIHGSSIIHEHNFVIFWLILIEVA